MKTLKSLAFAVICFTIFSGCSKTVENIIGFNSPKPGYFFEYRIPQGRHTSAHNPYVPIHTDQLNFTVRFDSSAVYNTIDPSNQLDVNKLYGFADNDAHHQDYSARFGWNWSHGNLKLFAYVYNKSVLLTQEVTTITPGTEYDCSIRVVGDQYIFTSNNITITLPREATTHAADGYKLYPYFGGDETAPHDIRIWIKEAASY